MFDLLAHKVEREHRARALLDAFAHSLAHPRGDAGFNLPGTPSDVEIIAHAYDVHDGFRRDKDPIEIKGNTRAALTLYAPGRDIDVEDRAAVYGAIVGDDVRVKNRAELHYDLALQDVDATAASVERLAWREQR